MTTTSAGVLPLPRWSVDGSFGSGGRHRAARRTRRRGAVLAALLVATVLLALGTAAAQARFSGGADASTAVGTATLAAPSPVTVTPRCQVALSRHFTATLSWPNVPRATGYLVTPIVNGAARTPVAVSGTSHTYDRNVVSVATISYRFTVTARVGGWTSAPTTTSTFTC